MIRRSLLTSLLFTITLIHLSCTSTETALQRGDINSEAVVTLNVFAAASLTSVFNEIGAHFAASHPGVEVIFNFAGSNQLATQIGHGAPADVFASANKRQMAIAIEVGRVVSETQRTFAHNRLLVITPNDNPARLSDLSDLGTPGLKIVLAATEVPVGSYTQLFLEKAVADRILDMAELLKNVVSYETNVRAVLSKVVLGEADAGIVYMSDAIHQDAEIQQLEIPQHLNILANYPIAPLADSSHPIFAEQFVAYVLGPEGQHILARYGFVPASGSD